MALLTCSMVNLLFYLVADHLTLVDLQDELTCVLNRAIVDLQDELTCVLNRAIVDDAG